MDFMNIPFFDNHTHSLEDQTHITPNEFASHFYHGCKDIFQAGSDEAVLISDELHSHMLNIGVIYALTEALAALYDCKPTIEAVLRERNKRTAGGIRPYAQSLYMDANIVGTVLDSDHPVGLEIVDSMPCRVYRLYQMDKALFSLFKTHDNYPAFRKALLDGIEDGITQKRFNGIKTHLSELYTNDIVPVSDTEAEAVYPAAKAGDGSAMEKIYAAILTSVMTQCQQLKTNIHIHTGVTGMSAIEGCPYINGVVKNGQPNVSDPFLLAPFLARPEFRRTRVVLLHGGYPWTRSLAVMAYMLPNVYIDLSVTLPWASFALDQYFEEVLGYAPHTKIILGTGQHGVPETAWLGARLAKQSLKRVLEKAAGQGMISADQAEITARRVLYQNAQTLFGS